MYWIIWRNYRQHRLEPEILAGYPVQSYDLAYRTCAAMNQRSGSWIYSLGAEYGKP